MQAGRQTDGQTGRQKQRGRVNRERHRDRRTESKRADTTRVTLSGNLWQRPFVCPWEPALCVNSTSCRNATRDAPSGDPAGCITKDVEAVAEAVTTAPRRISL